MNKYVVHCKKDKYDILIDRTTKWGNPFKEKSREENIEDYKNWVVTQHDLMNDLGSLKGKTLACWCAPKPCHGDVLSQLVNGDEKIKRILVAGSRSIIDYNTVAECLDLVLFHYDYKNIIGISGMATGVDISACRWFKENKIPCIEMPAKWKNEDGSTNKRAGFERNSRMVEIADTSIIIWDGESKGTLDTINKMKNKGIMSMFILNKQSNKEIIDRMMHDESGIEINLL